MSTTGYYTGAEEISASSGDFSTTDSITPNYEDGWAEIGDDVFSVPSSGSLPSGIPGNSNDVDLSDANEVRLVTVRIKDTNMLSAEGKPSIPTNYPFCLFPNDFNVLKGWSGVLYRGRNTDKVKDYDSEADAQADATLARPDTWVWYDGKWVSLIGNNPEDTFDDYGTNSSGQTEYFQHETAKENKGENSRYIERARVKLLKSTISSKFVTTYNGVRCAMMLLIPFKATEYTPDAVGNASNFSNTQVFYAINDIGETLYNVDTPNTIPTYYNTQNDGTEWTRLPGFYRNVSNVQSDMPYFKKAKTYTYLTAFNVGDDKYDIRKYFRLSYMGDTEYITSANWIVPYQRIYSRYVPESTSFSTRTFYYVYWNDEKGEWDISDSQVVASTEKRLLGVILQAPGGNGGPGANSTANGGGAGGGGGAYGEFMVNAYNNYIRVTLSKRTTSPDGGRVDAAPSEIEVSNGTNKIQVQCTAGKGGETGKASASTNAKGGDGGYVRFATNGSTNWNPIPMIMPDAGKVGDKDLVKWYSPNGLGAFSWDVACIGVIAAVPGGKGGNAYNRGQDGDNGATLSIIRGYDVAGVPSRNLGWSRGLEDISDNKYPYDTTSPGNHAGEGGAAQDYAGGGGGGASFYGKGGRGDTYNSNPSREEGIKGGGSGGSSADHTGWMPGSSGVLLLLK